MKRYICMHPTELGFKSVTEAQAWADLPMNKDQGYRVVEITDHDPKANRKAAEEHQAELEKAYTAGAEMARKLLRLQLGLAVPSDRS